jgi:hypothetical protein
VSTATLYLTNATAGYVPPTWRGAWDDTAGAVTKALAALKSAGGTIATVNRAETTATSPYRVALYRGVSAPLAAQTLSGTLDAIVAVLESAAAADLCWCVHAYVTQGDSDTPRGTILNDYTETTSTEWPTTAAGRALAAAQTLASLAITAGDRLVVEIGYIARNSSTTSYTGTLSYGTIVSADLREADDMTAGGSATTAAARLAFSVAIAEQVSATRVSQRYAEVAQEMVTRTRVSQRYTDVAQETVARTRTSQRYADVAQVTDDTGIRTSQRYADVAQAADSPAVHVSQRYADVATIVEVEVTFPADTSDGRASHPLGWLELTDRSGQMTPYAEVDLCDRASYYGGYKAPCITAFSPIVRGLSDATGQLQHATCGAVFSDTDRRFRALLDDPTNKYLTNRPIVVRIIDDEDRRVEATPRLMANGYVSDYSPEPNLGFRVTGSDWLKKRFSRKKRAQTAWQPRILKEDFPDAPRETIGLPAPIIYGAIGLSGAPSVEGVTLTPIARPAAPTSFVATPTTGGVNGGGFTSFWALTAIVSGVESDPAIVSLAMDATNNAAALTWDSYPSASGFRLYQAVTSDFTQFAELIDGLPAGTTSYTDSVVLPNQDHSWIDGTPWQVGLRMNLTYFVFAQLGTDVWSQPGTVSLVVTPIGIYKRRDGSLAWSAYTDALGYRILRQVSFYSGWGQRFDLQIDVDASTLSWDDIGNDDGLIDGGYAPPTGLETPGGDQVILPLTGSVKVMWVGSEVIDGTRWKRLLVARHACARVGRIDYSSSQQGTDTSFAGQTTFIRATAFGTEWLSPDEAGWPFAERYRDINGRRYTLVYTTVDPLPSTILVDVDGIEDLGDGTGTLIRGIHAQHKHWLRNWIAPETPYTSGSWLGPSFFPQIPTLPLVDETSFDAVAEMAAERISGGYEGATVIGASGEEVGVLDCQARFCVSGDHEVTFNRKWQLAATMEPSAPVTHAPTLSDVLSITDGTFRIIDEVTTSFFNVLPFRHTRDYTGLSPRGWASDDRGEEPATDADSIANYEQELEAPRVYEFHVLRATTTQGRATVVDVVRRVRIRFANPRRRCQFAVPFSGSMYDVGDIVPLTSIEGIGAEGWMDHQVRVDQHRALITDGAVQIEGYDMQPIYDALAADT